MLVDRASVIRAAAEFGHDGGVLVLRGPKAFGHLEALTFASKQLVRFGWLCHDLSSIGPRSTTSITLDGLESVFPTVPGGISQRGQLGDLGLSVLKRHATSLFTSREDRHAWFVPYCDDDAPLDRSDLDFWAGVASDRLAIVLTSAGATDWSRSGFDLVDLTGFDSRHVELCLRRRGLEHLEADWQAEAESLKLPDGSVLPVGAYTWLRAQAEPTGVAS